MAAANLHLAYSVTSAAAIAGVGRTFLYAEIRVGRLVARKAGRRTVVLDSDLRNWLASLPTVPSANDDG
jgi:hypothetical protein